ncbi:DUF1659 domain-containing protein [Filibacter tadaridae]|uniref:DUF1659 domain-containing protein n=1 Tax=Filibacter tadaridae TaxID=2483811 RepID=A0A3P5XG67_9BACL|nr:DUF1659 domain-containing protein [Filibacter tadaridae]VDC33788.1 hypothetical protein FILTAD_03048 [Filibacter tadaridae]
MAATIEFLQANGRVYFDGGMTDDGKPVTKSKTYRNVKENVQADKAKLQSVGVLLIPH